MAELISQEHLKKLFEHLSRMFDYIVVDVCRTFQDPVVTILDASDEILLLATNDIPAIKNAKLFFELADQLAYPPEKILLIINKNDGRSGIGAKDIEASIKHPVRGVIPRDERTNQLAINRGIPFVTLDRRLPLTQSLVALAKSLREPLPVSQLGRHLAWFWPICSMATQILM